MSELRNPKTLGFRSRCIFFQFSLFEELDAHEELGLTSVTKWAAA